LRDDGNVHEGVDGIILPKVESATGLAMADWLLTQLERERRLPHGAIDLVPIIETAKGLNRLGEILGAGTRVRRSPLAPATSPSTST
jgi:citrate lyase subunit beta/citryl-CoA lyase